MEKKEDLAEEEILDIDENDEEVAYIQYDISSYGADYTVDSLVKRLQKGDIFIPEFQRDYVWNQTEASRLVESLLLGLPIPGIFLAKEQDTNKLLIIDGQQRLRTLQYFYEGFFNPKDHQKTKRVFKLIKVQKKFENLTYENLSDSDRIKLDDSIIHATIVKQESPIDDNTSIYHVFERLNTGGKKLTPQEIRTAVYHGSLNDLITKLNKTEPWRDLFGAPNSRLKDQELILRFFATYYDSEKYSKPMIEFLNKFNLRHRNAGQEFLDTAEILFNDTVGFIRKTIGKPAFRPERVLNVSAFEAITVGTAKLLQRKKDIDVEMYIAMNKALMIDPLFIKAVTSGTSDDSVFKERQRLVEIYFSKI